MHESPVRAFKLYMIRRTGIFSLAEMIDLILNESVGTIL